MRKRICCGKAMKRVKNVGMVDRTVDEHRMWLCSACYHYYEEKEGQLDEEEAKTILELAQD